jgi:hypothetical protein
MKLSLQIELNGPAIASAPGNPGRSVAAVGIARPQAQAAPAHSGAVGKDLNCLPATATFLTSFSLSPSAPPTSPFVLSFLPPVVIVRRE